MDYYCKHCSKSYLEVELTKIAGARGMYMCPKCKGPCFCKEKLKLNRDESNNFMSSFIMVILAIILFGSGVYLFQKNILKSRSQKLIDLKMELYTYKFNILKLDKEIAQDKASFESGPVCPITGQRPRLVLVVDPRDDFRKKIKKCEKEIIKLEKKGVKSNLTDAEIRDNFNKLIRECSNGHL